MLLTKAFKITDDTGINELLTKYRLAASAHILVSDGNVLIPYEDGLPQNNDQHLIAIRENQNKLRAEKDIIEHSNRVLAHLVADAQDRVNVAQAEVESSKNAAKNAARQTLEQAQSSRDQLANQVKMNEHEINRIQVNIDEYDAQIAAL